MRVEFTHNLITGNEMIDNQHRELIDKLNALLDAVETNKGQMTAARTLHFLSDYVIFHFSAEEKLQEEVGYPGLADHKKQHEALKQTVEELTEMLEEDGPTPAFVSQLEQKVVEWLMKHIEGFDRSVAEYIFLAENTGRL